MPRATLTIQTDNSGEIESAANWFERWSGSLTRKSENYGCGCCVDLYDVEASQEAIDSIPEKIRSTSQWVESGKGFGGRI